MITLTVADDLMDREVNEVVRRSGILHEHGQRHDAKRGLTNQYDNKQLEYTAVIVVRPGVSKPHETQSVPRYHPVIYNIQHEFGDNRVRSAQRV